MSADRDEVNVGLALDLVGRKRDGVPAPMATCHVDDEPLVSTMEFPGAEFYCVVCGRTYGFLSPKPAEATPELEARHAVLREQHLAEREVRR